MSYMSCNNNKGFSLIELLLVMGLVIILAAATIPVYGNLQLSSQLNETTSQVIQAMRFARERSTAGFNNSAHGVYFEINASANDKIIIYQGGSYATRDNTRDFTSILDNSISLSTTITGADMNFAKSTGDPSTTGTVTINTADFASKAVRINSYGMVEEE